MNGLRTVYEQRNNWTWNGLIQALLRVFLAVIRELQRQQGGHLGEGALVQNEGLEGDGLHAPVRRRQRILLHGIDEKAILGSRLRPRV